MALFVQKYLCVYFRLPVTKSEANWDHSMLIANTMICKNIPRSEQILLLEIKLS